MSRNVSIGAESTRNFITPPPYFSSLVVPYGHQMVVSGAANTLGALSSSLLADWSSLMFGLHCQNCFVFLFVRLFVCLLCDYNSCCWLLFGFSVLSVCAWRTDDPGICSPRSVLQQEGLCFCFCFFLFFRRGQGL